MTKLSKMQQKIYDYIEETVQKQGYPPSVREIGAEMGLKSPSTVHFHLKHMEENGYLAKGAGKGRALTLIRRPGGEGVVKAIESKKDTDVVSVGKEVNPDHNKVPVVGNVAAGTPILAQECIEDYLTFDTGNMDGEYFALRVRGESMLNAGILPGDYVIVHQQSNVKNGDIVVALLNDEATVKRFNKKGSEIWLMPENEAYSPIDGRNASILGKVTAVVRQY